MSVKQYISRLIEALFGKEHSLDDSTSGDAGLKARIAALELDLKERDQRIAEMQKEYANLQAAKERSTSGAGQDVLEKLFKRVVGTLSSIDVLTALEKKGKNVAIADLINLIESIKKEFNRAGLETIGNVGEESLFDTKMFQRMSGGSVHANTPVIVQAPGYRMGEKILLKAMVSAKEG